MPQKQCAKCEEWFDVVFFRRTGWASALAQSGTRSICIGCEQEKRDAEKRKDRWPAKIRDMIRSHAERLKISVRELREDFGWEFDRMLHEAQHAYANGCAYCGYPFKLMGNGLSDLTLDIVNPTDPPYYATNVRWVCATCNREKSRTTASTWGAKRACWDKWLRRPKEARQSKLFE